MPNLGDNLDLFGERERTPERARRDRQRRSMDPQAGDGTAPGRKHPKRARNGPRPTAGPAPRDAFSYPDPPPSSANPESQEAADSIRGEAVRQQRILVLRTLGEYTALTCDQIQQAAGIIPQSASARCNDLAAMGLIQRTGERRPTRQGRSAAVWTPTQRGWDELDRLRGTR